MSTDYKDDSIGALWAKENAHGKYFTGKIEVNGDTIRILVTPNKKSKDTAPDWRIKRAQSKGERVETPAVQTAREDGPADDDLIPFAVLLPLMVPLLSLVA